MTTLLLIMLVAPVVYLTFKHFRAARKPAKRQAIPFPFPLPQGGLLNSWGEPRAFRKVDSAIAARDKRYDWPQP